MTYWTWLLLAAAAVLMPVRVPGRSRAGRTCSSQGLPLVLDLTAAALRSGQPLSAALQLGGPAAEPSTGELLVRVGRLLQLGAEADEAWRVVEDVACLAPVAAAARRSARSGVRLADAFERCAAQLRTEALVGGQARAHRAGVWAIGPLGACFLPAFVCLGIVPVVASLLRSYL